MSTPVRAVMGLSGLPIELFRNILCLAVEPVGFYDAADFRLVSKLFDREVPFAMYQVRLLETDLRVQFVPRSCPLVLDYVFRRVTRDFTGMTSLPAIIHRTVESLLGDQEESLEHLRDEYNHALSKTTLVKMGTHQTIYHLKSGLETNPGHGHSPEEGFESHLVVAAAYLGHLAFLQKLSPEFIRANSRSFYFGTALDSAAQNGHHGIVKLLLEHGLDVNETNPYGEVPLQTAAFAGHQEIVQLILEPEHGCHKTKYDYESAIIDAARGGHPRLIAFLVEQRPDVLSEYLQNRILAEAARYGHEGLVHSTLASGANPNYADFSTRQRGPLELAASHGYLRIVQVLLAHGAIQRREPTNCTVYLAARNGFRKVVDVLRKDDQLKKSRSEGSSVIARRGASKKKGVSTFC